MKRLCWADSKKLCVHGARLTEECSACVNAEARGDKGGFCAWDGVLNEWRETTEFDFSSFRKVLAAQEALDVAQEQARR